MGEQMPRSFRTWNNESKPGRPYTLIDSVSVESKVGIDGLWEACAKAAYLTVRDGEERKHGKVLCCVHSDPDRLRAENEAIRILIPLALDDVVAENGAFIRVHDSYEPPEATP